MTLNEFKKKRNKLIAKIINLAVEINEEGRYLADCEIIGHVNWLQCTIVENLNNETNEAKYVVDKLLHPYMSLRPNCKIDHAGEHNQYELIIADLQSVYDEMSEYLKIETGDVPKIHPGTYSIIGVQS
ncbi:MAG: hypothetical protein E6R13_05720 [Spirochaetes bacterium]|nr:MAG: hypothetical protein E6R13_05720 [Spirochaetota bacterium]